jgi:uncharacterized protein (DUF58 family)
MRPTRAALGLVAVWFCLGGLAAFWPGLELAFELAGGMFVVALLAEAIALWRHPAPRIKRALPPTMALGEHYDIQLSLESDRHEQVVVHDRTPERGSTQGLPARIRIRPDRPSQLTYRFRPLARGELQFEATGVQVTGPLRLLERELRVGEPVKAQVYPNFRRVAGFVAPGEESLYRGVHLQRRRGEGMEFYQLREYRDGDSLRQVDWKSVARRQQLISREYRSEQNQNVIFLVDCGRRMRAHDGELSLLDQSLDALLLLSYVALRQGDSVGLLTFSGTTRWLPPVRGAHGLSHVLDTVYDLESTAQASDFAEAVALLSARQRRRALIVLLTNLGDDDVDSLRDSLLPLQGQHLVLVASMRDPELSNALRQDVGSEQDATRMLSVLAYLDARRGARTRLGAAGVATLEAEPAALPQQLIERYLMIKRAGRL